MFEGGFYNIFIKIFLRKEKEQKRTGKQKKLFPKIRKRDGGRKNKRKKRSTRRQTFIFIK